MPRARYLEQWYNGRAHILPLPKQIDRPLPADTGARAMAADEAEIVAERQLFSIESIKLARLQRFGGQSIWR
jgi:hypothetical protein